MEEEQPRTRFRLKVAGMLAGALLYSLAAFLLLEWMMWSAGSGAITLTFLAFVPAALASAISYAADPEGERGLEHHLLAATIPVLVVLIGSLALGEGVICVIMLLPLWSVSALLAVIVMYGVRRSERRNNRLRVSAILLLPAITAQIELAMPVPEDSYVVERSMIIDAAPEAIWPYLLSIHAIGADEGRWNATQDLLGIPRPSEAVVRMREGEMVRFARWGPGIGFEELISERIEGRSLRWTFAFPDASVREHTDRHIAPDGRQLTIREGSYRLQPLPDGRSELILATRYELRTALNAYAAWWGDWMLGDIQTNILQIIKDRAEGAAR